jgi:peptidoglycan/xylan/chitin deacetylase (PgdA/CDA1 family)
VPRVRARASTLVLCYHAVSPTWPAALSVTPTALRRQLEGLLARGWTATTFTEAVTLARPGRTLAITFDDGYDSVRRLAAPLLAELGVPATLFVPTDWPGERMRWPGIDHWAVTPHADELQAMTWDDIRSLAADGWEIGSHTCSHPRLSTLGEDAIRRELAESRAACERELGQPCRSVAYPYGDADARVRAAAAATGYDAAAGLRAPALRRSRFEWPRVGIWHAEPDWRVRLKTAQPDLYPRLRAIQAHLRRQATRIRRPPRRG